MFFRNCPSCGTQISYKRKADFSFAIKVQNICRSCSARSRNKPRYLTGMRFGKLIVLNLIRNVKGAYYWDCLCDCGRHTEISTSNLTRAKVKTCGCSKQHDNPWLRKRPYEALFNFFVRSAGVSGHKVDLTYKEFVEFTKLSECFYCGNSITWTKHFGSEKYSAAYNLDRKDNSFGYCKDNCVQCCNDCNKAKGARYTFEEWVVMTAALKAYRQNRQRAASA